MPDVDNRAPSLVNWIARDLDANVRRLLSGAAKPGESVIADETVHVARDFNRKARWEQSWRLVDHTGVILKVTIQVLEENNSLVRVHVGSGVIADGVPPWIARRTEDSDVATDAAQRQRFYQWLDESIFMAVDRFRTERQRLTSRVCRRLRNAVKGSKPNACGRRTGDVHRDPTRAQASPRSRLPRARRCARRRR